MDIYSEGKNKLLRLNAWQNSHEYMEICAQQKSECERLVNIAQQIYATIDNIKAAAEQSVIRMEAAVGGDIHRGVYCPSPIFDIVIGNVHRGRILKRVASSSKISHYFGFDSEDMLLYSRAACDDMFENIEYIVRLRDTVYGLTVDPNYGPSFISEECYEGNKLLQYRYASLISEENKLHCLTLHSESYFYDSIGLKSSNWEDYQAISNVVQIWSYEFERVNGYLTSYKCVEQPFTSHSDSLPLSYRVKSKRKA